jgi:cytochrome c55X
VHPLVLRGPLITSRNAALRSRSSVSALRIVALLLVLPIGGAMGSEVSIDRTSELEHLLRHDCGSCHGMRLTGGLGPALTGAAMAEKSPASLRLAILAGRPGTAMPPWRGILTADEVNWLVEALRAGSFDEP